MQSFLYRSAELGDDPPRGRTPDYCSARDYHVSTSLRGEGRREGGKERGGGEEGRRRGEEKRGGEEKGGRRGERGEERRKGGREEGRSKVRVRTHTHTHTYTSLTRQAKVW